MFRLPSGLRGANVLGASRAEQEAFENEELGGGFFAVTLLKALENSRADSNGDGDIRVTELADFLQSHVSALFRDQEDGPLQQPTIVAFERDQDFVIGTKNK